LRRKEGRGGGFGVLGVKMSQKCQKSAWFPRGAGFQVHNRLVADLDESKMELVETQSFANEVTTALAKLKERDVRILLGNFNEFWARRIFCEAYRFGLYGRKYQWIIIGTYTRDWWLHPDGGCNIRDLSAALHGVILVDLLPLTNEGQHTTSGIVSEPRIELGSRSKPRGSSWEKGGGIPRGGLIRTRNWNLKGRSRAGEFPYVRNASECYSFRYT